MKKKLLTLVMGVVSLSGIAAVSAPIASSTQIQLTDSSKDSLKDSVSKQFAVFVQGSKEMMDQYETFVSSLQSAAKEGKGFKEADVERILNALCYAADCHQNQTRRNAKQTPYINHPLTVAENIVSIGKVYDADVVIAGLLIDTIDDTKATYEDIRKMFGSKVEGYIKELTEDKFLSSAKRKKLQIIHAPSKSKGAAIIKLSENLYNLNNLMQDPPMEWTRDRIDQYFQWAQTVVDNLPEANAPLKEEVHKVIHQYWKKQA
jgi:guanosine-3',5'-bis(diphosphate) 3'-pyrophosphohydrolase